MTVSNIFNKIHPMSKKTTLEVELEFTKMLAARLLMIIDGKGDFLSDFDKEAVEALRKCHPQDIHDVDFEGISLDHWETLNPGYVYANND